jgi:hypothetical protein
LAGGLPHDAGGYGVQVPLSRARLLAHAKECTPRRTGLEGVG